MVVPFDIDLSSYAQAREQGAFYNVENAVYLRLSGETRVDYLQRQTTNDIHTLSPDHVMHTVLTNPSARILDVLALIPDTGSEAIGVLPLVDRGLDTLAYFKGRIFFNDKVKFDDLSEQVAQVALLGQSNAAMLADLGIETHLEQDSIVRFLHTDIELTAYRVNAHLVNLLVPTQVLETVLSVLRHGRGAEIDAAIYEVLRVEYGLPGPSEMSESYTPLEIGLGAYISDSKGCYTGQEVIARQITYDKVTKKLVGVRSDEPIKVGVSLRLDGKKVGNVTSNVVSPTFGPVSLAVLKNDATEPGTEILTPDGHTAIVSTLPFHN